MRGMFVGERSNMPFAPRASSLASGSVGCPRVNAGVGRRLAPSEFTSHEPAYVPKDLRNRDVGSSFLKEPKEKVREDSVREIPEEGFPRACRQCRPHGRGGKGRHGEIKLIPVIRKLDEGQLLEGYDTGFKVIRADRLVETLEVIRDVPRLLVLECDLRVGGGKRSVGDTARENRLPEFTTYCE